MVYIIIFAIIGFFVTYDNDMWSDFIEGILGAVIGGVFGICVYGLVGGFLGSNLQTTETVETKEIYALNDSSAIEGARFLYSGYVNEELVYRYVVQSDKGKCIEEIDATNVYINEGDYTPHVEIHERKLKEGWYKWFAHDMFLESYTIIYVPSNTITTEYNIDLR